MAGSFELYDHTYPNFTAQVLDAIRKATFGEDIGQNSWLTVDEYARWLPRLNLHPGARVLEVACGSGGPALYLARTAGCRVTAVDNNGGAVATGVRLAAQADAPQVDFCVADATAELPFAAAAFDAVVCIDAMNHFPNRLAVLRSWHRLLRPGGRVLVTDPVVIIGPVTNAELALRSSIGLFLFVPPGTNEQLFADAGLRLINQEDVTANAGAVAERWQRARAAHRAELIQIEGEAQYEGLQRFFGAVSMLSREHRLARVAYLVEKPATG